MPGLTKAGYKPPVRPRKVLPEKPDRKPKKQKKQNGALVLSLIILLISVAAAGGILAVWKIAQPYQDTFLPGRFLSGCALQGMTAAEGAELLNSLTAQKLSEWKCELEWQGNSYILTAEDISLSVDAEATLGELWSRGRSGNLFSLFSSVLMGMTEHENAEPVVTMNTDPIAELLKTVKEDIDQNPQDASVSFSPDRAEPFTYQNEAVGYELDTEPLKEKILAAAMTLEPVTLELEPVEKQPSVTRSELENASVLRSRVSAVLDSGEALDNEKLALSALSGKQIQPGESWSFNEAVGARTAENGYVSAAEPAYGLNAEGIGGGVCRISSMMYQLALLAELSITERSQAVYPTPYADAGLEAAVSDQGLDLCFTNDTGMPLWIYVRTWTDEEDHVQAEIQLIGVPLTMKTRLESVQTVGDIPDDPVYVRDKEGRYAVYTDERVPVGEAKPSVMATVTRIRLDRDGFEADRIPISVDNYDAIPARIYVGATERKQQ